MSSRLAQNLNQTLAELTAHGQQAGRSSVARLIAVTKSVEPAVALELYALGQRDFGENRLQELERKCAAFAAAGAHAARWHFLGHLQRNKARRVVKLCYAIHSVDSLTLLESLERLAAEEGCRPKIFLEMALTGEANKTGFLSQELPAVLERMNACSHLEACGLMAMAPLIPEPAQAGLAAAKTFAQLAELARSSAGPSWATGRAQLSMGMSADWPAAVAAGSDWVRIGSALFEGLEDEPPVDSSAKAARSRTDGSAAASGLPGDPA